MRAASGDEQAIVVIGSESEGEMGPLCFEAGADAYLCIHTTATRTLIWQLARAMERHRLIAENSRLADEQRRRLKQEHDEAGRLLEQQRAMIADLERIRSQGDADMRGDPQSSASLSLSEETPDLPVPAFLTSHYQDLLRAYVVMGTGNLSQEMEHLAELLVSAGISAQQAMQMHLHVLEQMVAGLGSRGARHVMNRADLLVLEVMVHLVEAYQRRCLERVGPPAPFPHAFSQGEQ
jgi:hypothetical protein